MPVSATVNFSDGLLSRQTVERDVDDDLALLGELDRVADEIEQHLPQPARIADERRRHAGLNSARKLEPLFVRARRQQPDGILDRAADVERHMFEREPARFDLGEVEDLVDQRQQGFARLLDRAEIVPLRGRQRRPEREVRHADDRVHRRADLVAHVRQELAFRHRGLLGPPLRELELPDELGQALGIRVLFPLRGFHIARVCVRASSARLASVMSRAKA